MNSYSKKQTKRLILLVTILSIAAVSVWLHLMNNESPNYTDSMSTRVITPDWGVGATLIAMDYPPVAIGDKRIYPVWVNQPKLPNGIIDIGHRAQSNAELLAQLQPDFIFNTFFYNNNLMFYNADIPVYDVDFGFKNNSVNKPPKWSRFTEPTQKIGVRLNKQAQANQYIATSKQRIIDAGNTVHQHISDDKRLLVIDFWDARQVNITTINSPISLAIQMMGYEMVSLGNGSQWGNTSLPMHTLYELPGDVCLIISEPIPQMTKYDIAHSPVWQRSPFFKPDACIYKIDPVWSNGGIEVLVSFAENLEKAVTTQKQNEFSYEYVAQDAVQRVSQKAVAQ